MRTWVLSLLTAGALLTAAIPAAAQTRPHVSGSETSHRSAPTCVVNGDASACGESGASGTLTLLPGPVIVGVAPVMSASMSPVTGPVLGGSVDGRASTDTDVNRSTHHGSALSR
jgi:hypothetical protein